VSPDERSHAEICDEGLDFLFSLKRWEGVGMELSDIVLA
jgi:hypothetical protein